MENITFFFSPLAKKEKENNLSWVDKQTKSQNKNSKVFNHILTNENM